MSQSSVTISLPFARHRLEDFCTFISTHVSRHLPKPSKLVIGDIAWQLPGCDPNVNIQLWYSGDDLVGFGWFQPPYSLDFDVSPEHADAVLPEILHWAVQRRREFPEGTLPYLYVKDMDEWTDVRNNPEKYQRDDVRILVTSAFDDDETVIEALENFGFEATDHTSPHMLHDLDIPESNQPGIVVRAIGENEIEDYVSAHRDAWGSSFSSDRLKAIMTVGNIFDPDLCLVAEVAGAFAATTIFWKDPISGVADIEPFGVRPHYRGWGVSKPLIFEGLRKVREKGMHYGRVNTAGFNLPEQRLYQSCGFEVVGTCRSYKKAC